MPTIKAPTKREERWPDIYCGTWWYCRECWIAHERDYHPHSAPTPTQSEPEPEVEN